MINAMSAHEWHGDKHPASRIASLERELSIRYEIEARLLIQIKERDDKIARLEDHIAALSIDQYCKGKKCSTCSS